MGAYSRENPSPRYREHIELYEKMHAEGAPEQGDRAEDMFAGQSLTAHVGAIEQLTRGAEARTLLDYGCGKGRLYGAKPESFGGAPGTSLQQHWHLDSVRLYDPAYPPHQGLPDGVFDGVICTDVLEHVPEEDVDWVLREILSFATKFVYLNIACYPAKKILPNGENAHCTIREQEWWLERLMAAGADAPHLKIVLIFTMEPEGQKPKKKRGVLRRLFG